MANVETIATALRAQLSGEVWHPGHHAYDTGRRVHNGMIDRRPALIVRCQGVADVQAAVRAAREHGLEIAVRGGGHNVAGNAVCDDGLMIDLAGMRGVHVDPTAHRARTQGGATWGDYNRETQIFGLCSTGGVVSSTGVAGLTLGGGLGWLMGRHGMAVDSLKSASIVDASGEVIRTSADAHPDLFWAIRGGGGNFGIAAWLDFELYPVGPILTAGPVLHPFAAARDVLRFFRDLTANLPDEFSAFGGLIHAPDGSGGKLAAIIVCHCGDLESGRVATEPVKKFGTPCGRCHRADAVLGGEYAVRRRLPARRAQLLEVQLPRHAERRGHRPADRPVRVLSVTDERFVSRALPWRRHARADLGNSVPASTGRLQPAGGRRMDGSGAEPGERGVGAEQL